MTKHKRWSRVLHPNRYFIWAIAYIVVSFLALLSYIYVSSINLDNQSVFSQQTRKTYTNSKQGFTVKYPMTWELDNDPSGNIVFQNPNNIQESITVTEANLNMETIIRHSMTIVQETSYDKPGYSVSTIKAERAKDGSHFDVAIVKTSKHLFYISGISDSFQAFVNNFEPVIK